MKDKLSFEVKNSYFSIDEGKGLSLQLNRISWNNNDPKYDLRRWKDGQPLKGFSLSEESLRELCKRMAIIAAKTGIATQEVKSILLMADKDVNTKVAYQSDNLSRAELLELLSQPEFASKQLQVKEVIENGRIQDYLLYNNIKTLETLITILKDDSIHDLIGFSPNKEDKIYDALFRFVRRPKRTNLETVQPVFMSVDDDYLNLPIQALQLFTQKRKPIATLISLGYSRIGELRGMLESTLENLVGSCNVDLFIDIESSLSIKPELLISELWDKMINTRNGKITLERAKGKSLQRIGDKEGLTRERIRQVVQKFYYHQDPFLLIIQGKIKDSDNKTAVLKRLFPKTQDRCLYRLWEDLQDS